MDLFSIDLTVNEIQLLRQSLDIITITGKDAKFVASLQSKLERELNEIANMINAAEIQKAQDLQAAIAADRKKK
jgi:hypothetical protein